MRSLSALCACAVVASVTPAHAGAQRTLEPVALRKKPGEKEAVVARLAAGTEVTVLAIDEEYYALLLDLDHMLSAEQRAKAVANFRRYADDFTLLAGRAAPEQPSR